MARVVTDFAKAEGRQGLLIRTEKRRLTLDLSLLRETPNLIGYDLIQSDGKYEAILTIDFIGTGRTVEIWHGTEFESEEEAEAAATEAERRLDEMLMLIAPEAPPDPWPTLEPQPPEEEES